MKNKLKIIISILVLIITITTVSATLNVSLADHGSNIKNKTSGILLNSADLRVEIYDSASSGNLIYNETFSGVIINGSWNIMLGENSSNPLSLAYGKLYYKDYIINEENVNFTNLTGNNVDRQFFYSPLGDIAGEDINGSFGNVYLNTTGVMNASAFCSETSCYTITQLLNTTNLTYSTYNATGLIINWSNVIAGSNLNDTGLVRDWNISNWIINWNASNWIINWNATGLIRSWSAADWNSSGLIQNWNTTGHIQDWNSSGLIREWASASETDPLWTANITNYFTKAQWNVTNSSYLMIDQFNTTNSTYNAYNSTGLIRDWNVSGWIRNQTLAETNWNATGLIRSWSAADWNSSGLIRDWNISGWIRNQTLAETNWNSSGLIRDWNVSGWIRDWAYINTWTANITNYFTKAQWNVTNTSYLMIDQWNATNSSYLMIDRFNVTNTTYRTLTNSTFTTNINISEANITSTGLNISSNETCIILWGSTSKLEIC